MLGLAIKTPKCQYIATASNYYTQKSCCFKESNMPVWTEKNLPNSLLAYLGESRPLNVLRNARPLLITGDSKPTTLTSNYVIRHVLTNAIGALKDGRLVLKDELVDKIWAPMYVADKSNIFKLDPYGNCVTIHDFDAAGQGFERVYSALFALRSCKDIRYRILKSMMIGLELDDTGSYPIIIRNTLHPEKVEVYDMLDAALYVINYEKGVRR